MDEPTIDEKRAVVNLLRESDFYPDYGGEPPRTEAERLFRAYWRARWDDGDPAPQWEQLPENKRRWWEAVAEAAQPIDVERLARAWERAGYGEVTGDIDEYQEWAGTPREVAEKVAAEYARLRASDTPAAQPIDVEAVFTVLGGIIPRNEPAPWWLTKERFIARLRASDIEEQTQ